MGFFDLNIPYHESDRHVTDKSSLNKRRLKLTLKAMELGYTGVAYNRILKGVMSESHRCSTPRFPLSKITSSSSFSAAVEFHRRLLNVPVSSPFRQYTRLTVVIDIPTQASALNSGNPILRSYDIVAVRPMNQNAFDQACRTSEVDIIAIDFAEKLPFRVKQNMVKAAIKRGVYFEITYSSLISDVQSRRQMISNCKLLVDWTRGKNLIFSSAAPSATELRGPQDVANLFSVLGLPMQHAKEAISKNCRCLLANALRKKQFYKEAIKVEEITSSAQTNPEQSSFDDWLKWDPISSGEGDLLLEDMKKSFSISNSVTKNVKTLDFVSAINGLPAHGLQIKDLISMTKPDLEPPDITNSVSAAMDIDEEVSVCEDHEEKVVHNLMPVDPGSHLDAFPKEQKGILLPEIHASSRGISGVREHLLDLTPRQQVSLLPLLPAGNQTSLDDAKIRCHGLASGLEDCAMSSIPTDITACINSGELVYVSSGDLQDSNDMGANLIKDETQSQDTLSKMCGENALPDDGHVVSNKHKAESSLISDSHVSALNKSTRSAFDLEEPCMENRCYVGKHETKGVAVDEVPDKICCENGNVPLALSGVSCQDAYAAGEKYSQMNSAFVPLGGGLPVGILEPKSNFKEPVSEGRERRKRNPPHQHMLFPFKRFMNPRPFKKKARR